jgi:hypothetical protein
MNGSLSREELSKMFDRQIRAKLSLLRIGYRVVVRVVTPKLLDYKKVWENMKLDQSIQNAEFYYNFDSKEILNKILDFVFEFADVDKNGSLSESECRNCDFKCVLKLISCSLGC